uniref:triphosphoribosyl-dephospho-CoA synthase n=1 Tax=Pseudomonas aeruginosa TaxID=287 RepID=UPI001F0CC961
MNAIANLAATLRADLGECLADLAVDALIDEAELSPKPALVDRRGNGAHADLHLGLMQASALSLWPCFKEMADAAQRHGRIDARLRGVLGQLGRDGEAAMLRTTDEVQRTSRVNDEEHLHAAVALASRCNAPLVATNDVRFIKQEDF